MISFDYLMTIFAFAGFGSGIIILFVYFLFRKK